MNPKFWAWDKEGKTMDTIRRFTWTDGDITDTYLENIGLRRLDQVTIMQIHRFKRQEQCGDLRGRYFQ